ncbi:MAG TPA: PEGA domain-containing protein [Sphingomicrobium sp.]
MRLIAFGGLAAACVLLSACATITRGTNQTFKIESTPSQADARLSTGQTCVTPCEIRMKRKSDFVVTVSKEGYQTQEARVHGVVKGGGGAAMAGNVIFGGLIGAGVDASNGSMMNLKPNPLQVTLVPVASAEQAAPAATAPAAAPADAAAAAAPTGNE